MKVMLSKNDWERV